MVQADLDIMRRYGLAIPANKLTGPHSAQPKPTAVHRAKTEIAASRIDPALETLHEIGASNEGELGEVILRMQRGILGQEENFQPDILRKAFDKLSSRSIIHADDDTIENLRAIPASSDNSDLDWSPVDNLISALEDLVNERKPAEDLVEQACKDLFANPSENPDDISFGQALIQSLVDITRDKREPGNKVKTTINHLSSKPNYKVLRDFLLELNEIYNPGAKERARLAKPTSSK